MKNILFNRSHIYLGMKAGMNYVSLVSYIQEEYALLKGKWCYCYLPSPGVFAGKNNFIFYWRCQRSSAEGLYWMCASSTTLIINLSDFYFCCPIFGLYWLLIRSPSRLSVVPGFVAKFTMVNAGLSHHRTLKKIDSCNIWRVYEH